MVGWPGVLLSGELGDLTEDVRRLFQELGHVSTGRGTAAGDCLPPLDVLETDENLQILMDLPGVPAAGIRVLIKGSVVLIAGEKWADAPGPGAGGYHLVECGDLDEALSIAMRIPTLRVGGTVEVRPLDTVLHGTE